MAILYKHEWYEKLQEQDRLLVFDAFEQEDALQIGLSAVELAKRYGNPASVRVVFDDLVVFSYFMPGTSLGNVWWMDKKIRVAKRTGVSSLLSHAQLLEGDKAPEPWNDDEENYALHGGCVTIKNRDGAVVGYVVTSGLQHYEDHQLGVDTVAKRLGIEVPVIGAQG